MYVTLVWFCYVEPKFFVYLDKGLTFVSFTVTTRTLGLSGLEFLTWGRRVFTVGLTVLTLLVSVFLAWRGWSGQVRRINDPLSPTHLRYTSRRVEDDRCPSSHVRRRLDSPWLLRWLFLVPLNRYVCSPLGPPVINVIFNDMSKYDLIYKCSDFVFVLTISLL